MSNETTEAVRALDRSLRQGRTALLAASDGDFAPELIRHICAYRGLPIAESYVFGEDPLAAGLPEVATADAFESALRRDFAAAGDPLDGDGPEEMLVVVPPAWKRVLDDQTRVLALRDLRPPKGRDDHRLDRLAALVRQREADGYQLPDQVTLVITTDPKLWADYHLAGFAASIDADVVPWGGPIDASDTDDWIRLLREDPMTFVNLEEILADVEPEDPEGNEGRQ
jgi:hypothetical protein